MEFTAADIFQHSPFGDIMKSLKSLSLSGEPWPDYGQRDWYTDDEEIQSPPTTHFVATIEPFGDIMKSLKSLSLSGEPWPDYGQRDWYTDDEEIQSPPTTHFVATIDDLTDMLDFDSEDIDGMDTDEGDDEELAPIGPWNATSSYDVYMVDAPKDDDEERKDAPKACSLEKQSKRRRKRPITQTQRWSRVNRCRITAIQIIKPNKQILSRIMVRTT